MPGAGVPALTDRYRIDCAASLWRSRFGHAATQADLARLTDLSPLRISVALGHRAAPAMERKRKPLQVTLAPVDAANVTTKKRHTSPPRSIGEELLHCQGCGAEWARPRQRGRKPSRCPQCR